ncbi:MAG TPA: hypothetical protein VHM48_02605, partial [Candidatus Limnocylindrales bacterium]|nr:hypothetical protein [Candidatus Limnocylindrales bacterium]
MRRLEGAGHLGGDALPHLGQRNENLVGAAVKAAPGIEFPAGADEVLVPLTQMRKGIAAQMTRALQAPHAYVQMEID